MSKTISTSSEQAASSQAALDFFPKFQSRVPMGLALSSASFSYWELSRLRAAQSYRRRRSDRLQLQRSLCRNGCPRSRPPKEQEEKFDLMLGMDLTSSVMEAIEVLA